MTARPEDLNYWRPSHSPPDRNHGAPLRVIQVGTGAMGRFWLRVLRTSTDAQLVGVVDLDTSSAKRATHDHGFADVPIATHLTPLVHTVQPDAVINVTVPAAHSPINKEALSLGLPVLCEKPIAPTVAEALAIAATADVAGNLLMISQSRRYFNSFNRLRRTLGQLGHPRFITCNFFRSSDATGYRRLMTNPLLVDMAIHHFDAVRHLLSEEVPLTVYCETFNADESDYLGDACAAAIFQFPRAARFVYAGSWCAQNHETSWNGKWHISAPRGTASWDGENEPVVTPNLENEHSLSIDMDPPSSSQEVAGVLAEFTNSLRTGSTPVSNARSNVFSLAMVEAAELSAASAQKVELNYVMNIAYSRAMRLEQRSDVRSVLQDWRDKQMEHTTEDR